jgi:hypothetical protein
MQQRLSPKLISQGINKYFARLSATQQTSAKPYTQLKARSNPAHLVQSRVVKPLDMIIRLRHWVASEIAVTTC